MDQQRFSPPGYLVGIKGNIIKMPVTSVLSLQKLAYSRFLREFFSDQRTSMLRLCRFSRSIKTAPNFSSAKLGFAYPDALASLPSTRVTTLPNGFRIATETNPNYSTATVGMWIDAGSRFETAESNGAAHFLEHMAFKVTSAKTREQSLVHRSNSRHRLKTWVVI